VYLVADRLLALSMAGIVKWTFNGVPAGPEPPVVSSDMVYLPGQSQIVAVDPATGKKRFAIPSGGGIAVDGSRLYKVTYAADGQQSSLEAFNRRTGARLWSVPLPAGDAPERHVPTVANGIVYSVLADGAGAFAATDGRALWHWSGFGRGRVVVANANVYFDSGGAVQFHL
jgi:outer membrane protein assembly factor BamB